MEQQQVTDGESDLDVEFEEKCQHIFNLFDADGDGQLTEEEILKGYHMFEMNPTPEELKETMEALDIDHSGTVDFKEFKTLMRRIDQEEERMREKKQVTEAFKKLDRRKRGYLDKRQFTMVVNGAKKSGAEPKFKKDEIDEFFKAVDTNGDGKIDLEEFVEAFTGDQDAFASVRKPEYELQEEQDTAQQEEKQQ
ncbi:uncharacterized protein [Argopecten irradians]|uniref:uncharacterized protein n=1 Tax=Argopecten irradians TaxID=31199 RepID=UPI0037199A01